MPGKKRSSNPWLSHLKSFWAKNKSKMSYKAAMQAAKKTYTKKTNISLLDFEKKFYYKYNKQKWKNNIIDVLYALESKPHYLLKLGLENGQIKTISIN